MPDDQPPVVKKDSLDFLHAYQDKLEREYEDHVRSATFPSQEDYEIGAYATECSETVKGWR